MGEMAEWGSWGLNHMRLSDVWVKQFVWIPRKCAVTGKLLWLTTAYHCVKRYREDYMLYTRPSMLWHSKVAHTLHLLKGD